MQQTEITELVRLARSGSAQAYDELVGRYNRRLFGYLVRQTGHRADAEELLQDIWVRVVSGLTNYREQERFEVWLFRLARNRVIDHWRKHRPMWASDCRSDDGRDGDDGDVTLRRVSDEPDPAAVSELREDQDRLGRAMEQLSSEQRETILLRYFSQASFEEIATVTGCPLGTVLARAHRGLAKLRKVLTGGANDER
jgi:RNA polymerase sigma-70 factor (ECF subfamily)